MTHLSRAWHERWRSKDESGFFSLPAMQALSDSIRILKKFIFAKELACP